MLQMQFGSLVACEVCKGAVVDTGLLGCRQGFLRKVMCRWLGWAQWWSCIVALGRITAVMCRMWVYCVWKRVGVGVHREFYRVMNHFTQCCHGNITVLVCMSLVLDCACVLSRTVFSLNKSLLHETSCYVCSDWYMHCMHMHVCVYMTMYSGLQNGCRNGLHRLTAHVWRFASLCNKCRLACAYQCYLRKGQLLTVAKWVGEWWVCVEETTTTLQTSSCAHYSFQLLMKVTLLGTIPGRTSVCSGTGVQCVCPCIERYHCVVVILGWPHRGPLCIIDPTITSFVCHSKEARRCFVPNGPTLMYVHTYVRTCIVYMQFVVQSVYATHTTT